MTPTAEQQTIIDRAKSTRDNILISALAGAAKTTTLGMIASVITGVPIMSIAFNKRIAEEMSKKLPSHVSASTLNSVGHRAWGQFLNRKKITVDTKKNYNILKELIENLKGSERTEAFSDFSDTLRAIARAKTLGYIPPGKFPDKPHPVSLEEFIDSFEEPPTELQIELINDALVRSVTQGFDGLIDYDDQISLPVLFGGIWPRFPITMVDEAQDLSAINILMLEKLVGDRRLFAVGDRFQSIYAFRSAMSTSMDEIASRFSMSELTLSTSFRCARAIVLRARERAPTMQWAPDAPEGSIEALSQWSADTIPENAAIICRNNAPLMRLAFALLRAGRSVEVVGRDIGPGLAKTLKKLGPEGLEREAALSAIDRWEETQLLKSRAKASVSDRADCLRVFVSNGKTLGEAIIYCEHIFKQKGTIQLLSGHKSKGLEFETVFHLDPWRIPSKWATTPEELTQEENLDYVITTRAKRTLYFINMDDMK